MTMSADALALTSDLDAESAEMAAQISASAAAMATMIGDLLDFTGTGLGAAMPVSPAPMDLRPLGQEVVDEMQAANPGRALRFDARGDLTGEWDAARLRQVLSNLLGNALHHGGADAPVRLSVTADTSAVHLAVRNAGPPIPPDALPTIFDPLVRGQSPDAQKRRRPGSIGLGLYIAREVVTAHGGTIDVASSAESGTLFTVHLPRRHRRRPMP
jgi:hypothetical protein